MRGSKVRLNYGSPRGSVHSVLLRSRSRSDATAPTPCCAPRQTARLAAQGVPVNLIAALEKPAGLLQGVGDGQVLLHSVLPLSAWR